MTPEGLAALHARCFERTPRAWTAPEFAALLAEPTTILITADGGFALGRTAGTEAEVLTLAVEPARRRQGVARALVARLEAAAAARGAQDVFLEVAATNLAATALYAGLGYAPAGIRRNYYAPGLDAHVLKKRLQEGAAGHGKTI